MQVYLGFEDAEGQHHLRRALEVAIAGKHNILVIGADNLPIHSIEKATLSLVTMMGEGYYAYKPNKRIRYISNHIKFVDVPDCKCEVRKHHWQHRCNCDYDTIDVFNKNHLPMYYKTSDMYLEYGYGEMKSEYTSARNEESTESIIKRIEQSRSIQYKRNMGAVLNNNMNEASIRTHCNLDEVSISLMEHAKRELKLTSIQKDSILRVSRTIADLAGDSSILPSHLAEAIQYKYKITG